LPASARRAGNRRLLRGELSGSSLLTGGAFGVEGSVLTLVVLCAAAACFLRGALKRGS